MVENAFFMKCIYVYLSLLLFFCMHILLRATLLSHTARQFSIAGTFFYLSRDFWRGEPSQNENGAQWLHLNQMGKTLVGQLDSVILCYILFFTPSQT